MTSFPYASDTAPVVGDPVVTALGALGAPVDCTGLRSLSLEGPSVLWLVEHGALDLFAVDAAHAGAWHFLGRAGAGALLLGPAEGPDHTLVGRPTRECLLRRIELRELYRQPYEPSYEASYDGSYGAQYEAGAQAPGPLEAAFALGVGRGLRVLYEAPLGGATAGAGAAQAADDDIVWMHVAPGAVGYGPAYDLLVDAALWQGMVEQQYRLLYALDEWIEERERAQEDRTAAGLAAGRAA
ncbi:NHLP bacteriocin export ABC transporter permease/ATPase subunit, partial [Streptomyces sp. NPDC003943]